MLVANVAEAVDQDSADDVDALFTFLQRRNDLLLRLGQDRWLLLLDASGSELEAFQSHLQETLAEANRSRLRGPLPALNCVTVGTWMIVDQKEIERRAAEVFDVAELVMV